MSTNTYWRIRNIFHGAFAGIFLNHQELRSRLAFLSAGSRRQNYEVLFYEHRHGTHDQFMCLIFLLLDQFHIRTKYHFEILHVA